MSQQQTVAPATELRPGDIIVVNLAAVRGGGGAGGQRAAVNGVFNHTGAAINKDGTPLVGLPGLDLSKLSDAAKAPTFPLRDFQAAVAKGDLREADRIRLAHTAAQEAFEQQGGGTIADAIGHAAIEWAKANFGVRTEGDGQYEIIKPSEVMVKPVNRVGDNPIAFMVQMQPVWG